MICPCRLVCSVNLKKLYLSDFTKCISTWSRHTFTKFLLNCCTKDNSDTVEPNRLKPSRGYICDHLFSMESMLEWSSHSSSVLSCLEERIRWWPVKHRVPSTVGMKGRCRTTPSTLGVFINSANSISWPDQKKDDSYFKDWFRRRVWNLHQTYGESYRWLTITATTVCWLNISADFVQMGANESRTDKWFMKWTDPLVKAWFRKYRG